MARSPQQLQSQDARILDALGIKPPEKKKPAKSQRKEEKSQKKTDKDTKDSSKVLSNQQLQPPSEADDKQENK